MSVSPATGQVTSLEHSRTLFIFIHHSSFFWVNDIVPRDFSQWFGR